MRIGSLFSGIGAPEKAWQGWDFRFCAEIDPFGSATLAHHYGTPNLGDVTKIDGTQWRGKIDLLVGGSPCQAFSVAGLRRSLDDERGNLTLEFVRLCDEIQPPIIVWENVPGVLSTKDNAFGCFLAGLVGSASPLVPAKGQRWTNAGMVVGPKRAAAWRVLDAQHFGVPQRRRRVFLVAVDLRVGGRLFNTAFPVSARRLAGLPAAILLEPESVSRNTAPSSSKEECPPPLFERLFGSDRGNQSREDGNPQTSTRSVESAPVLCFSSKDDGGDVGTIAPTLRRGNHNGTHINAGIPLAIAYDVAVVRIDHAKSNGWGVLTDGTTHAVGGSCGAVAYSTRGDENNDIAPTIDTNGLDPRYAQGGVVAVPSDTKIVRRLTPVETLRLQGFPDDYFDFLYKGKPIPDGTKYRAIGNSMAVPVMSWIQQRIDKVLKEIRLASVC